jgi:hypothetical protein
MTTRIGYHGWVGVSREICGKDKRAAAIVYNIAQGALDVRKKIPG